MGSSQSIEIPSDSSEDEEKEENDDEDDVEDDDDVLHSIPNGTRDPSMIKKILEQEPEMLPCHASASPLSPQLSAHGTPRVGPSIKVWDPYNVLAPPPPLPPPPTLFNHPFSGSSAMDDDRAVTEVYFISHGECHMNLRPDLMAGRCPDAALTPNGKRQGRTLAVFLKSQGVRFNAVYTSPLDRARATALSVCQELNFSEEHVQLSDALTDMSQGHWEGCHRSDILTPETLSLMEKSQPDFCAPSGESLRQVEFRMVQFLNSTVASFPVRFRPDFSLLDPTDYPTPNSNHRQRHGLHRKKSGKSRLQVVTTGDNEADDEMSPRVPTVDHGLLAARDLYVRTSSNSSTDNNISSHNHTHRDRVATTSTCIGVFSHPTPIKCLLTGVLGCSPAMSNKICVEDSSVTVLQHSWKLGWQIKRLNDTSHLRLL